MAIESFTKQSYEKFFIGADFSNVLDEGESISLISSSVTAIDSQGADASSIVLESGSMAVSDSKLLIRVQNGEESLSPYKITFKIVTDLSNQYELDVRMKIKEV